MRDKIEIYRQDDPGYKTQFCFGAWRVGLLREDDRFVHVTYLERHLLTDEAFALLEGRAALITRSDGKETFTEMLPGSVYNIPQGLLHNIVVSPDATVIIAENAETGRENTEYEPFDMAAFPADLFKKIRG